MGLEEDITSSVDVVICVRDDRIERESVDDAGSIVVKSVIVTKTILRSIPDILVLLKWSRGVTFYGTLWVNCIWKEYFIKG